MLLALPFGVNALDLLLLQACGRGEFRGRGECNLSF